MDFRVKNVANARKALLGFKWSAVNDLQQTMDAEDLIKMLPVSLRETVSDAIHAAGKGSVKKIIRIFKEEYSKKQPNRSVPEDLVTDKQRLAKAFIELKNQGAYDDYGVMYLKNVLEKQTVNAEKVIMKLVPAELLNSINETRRSQTLKDAARLIADQHTLTELGIQLKKADQRIAPLFTIKTEHAMKMGFMGFLTLAAVYLGYVKYRQYRKMRGKARAAVTEFAELERKSSGSSPRVELKSPQLHNTFKDIEMSKGSRYRPAAPLFPNRSPSHRSFYEANKARKNKENKARKNRFKWFDFKIERRSAVERERSVRGKSPSQSRGAAPPTRSCPRDQILNPQTGRCVSRKGPIGRKLVAK